MTWKAKISKVSRMEDQLEVFVDIWETSIPVPVFTKTYGLYNSGEMTLVQFQDLVRADIARIRTLYENVALLQQDVGTLVNTTIDSLVWRARLTNIDLRYDCANITAEYFQASVFPLTSRNYSIMDSDKLTRLKVKNFMIAEMNRIASVINRAAEYQTAVNVEIVVS
jgi:hypothetical protein